MFLAQRPFALGYALWLPPPPRPLLRAASTTPAEELPTTTTTRAARVNPRAVTSAAVAALVLDYVRGLRLERTRSCSRTTRVDVPSGSSLCALPPCDRFFFCLLLGLFFFAVELFPTQAFFLYLA